MTANEARSKYQRQYMKEYRLALSERDANELIGLYYLKSIAERKKRSIYD